MSSSTGIYIIGALIAVAAFCLGHFMGWNAAIDKENSITGKKGKR